MNKKPIIGITMGDPVGIGPEIVIKALCSTRIQETCCPLIFGDTNVLEATNKHLNTHLQIHPVETLSSVSFLPGTVNVVSLSSLDSNTLRPGIPDKATGRAMVAYVDRGISWAIERRISGLVTGPINKFSMHQAGFPYNGHTEILASRTGTKDYVMMLAGPFLRVSLVSIHVALKEICHVLSTEAIFKTITVTDQGLREAFGFPEPRLAVAGLNPHAGEGGIFGDEEKTIIEPAIGQARQLGINVTGPLSPDTVFYLARKGSWDAVVALYHDQGLIPFKMVHFEDGVNTTLGLPIIRTSVDHGTAYNIAGTGQAHAGSMIAAIEMATLQARNRGL